MDYLPKDPAILVSSVNIELAIGSYVDDMSQELYH